MNHTTIFIVIYLLFSFVFVDIEQVMVSPSEQFDTLGERGKLLSIYLSWPGSFYCFCCLSYSPKSCTIKRQLYKENTWEVLFHNNKAFILSGGSVLLQKYQITVWSPSFPLRSTEFWAPFLWWSSHAGLSRSVSPRPTDLRQSPSHLSPWRPSSPLPGLLLSSVWFWPAEAKGQHCQQGWVLVWYVLQGEPDMGAGSDAVLRHTGGEFSQQLLQPIQQFLY